MATISFVRCALILTLYLLSVSVRFVKGSPTGSASRKIDLLTYARLQSLKSCLVKAGMSESQLVPRGDLILDTANRTQYEEFNFQWNTLYGQIKPMAYLLAEGASDVSAAVRCCAEAGVRVVARSGGHSYLKYGFGDANSLIVDLQRMNWVQVNAGTGTATIGAGARGGKVQYELWAADGYLLPTGLCPTVGIAGYTLGGGYGHYSRLFGLAADNLLQATVVDWTGALLTVNSSTDADFLWALRGGGGGSFGIVTDFKFKIHRAPNQIIWAVARYDFEEFPRFWRSWQAFISKDGDGGRHLGTFLSIGRQQGIVMELYSIGGGQEEVDRVLREKFSSPRTLTVTLFTYPEFIVARAQHYASPSQPIMHPEELVNLTRHNRVGWKKLKSIYVDRVLEREEDILELHELLRGYSQWSSMGVEQYGGAINALPPGDTAFSHRGRVLYSVQLFVFSSGSEGEAARAAAVEAMNRFFEESKRVLGHTESYQNYLDEDIPDYLQRYYGNNLERLVAVKRRVDPQNMFHNPMSVPLSF